MTTLRLTDIEPNKEQPRKQFDEDALSELSQSIAQHGVLQPLLVRPMTNGTYQLVAGERRWRAARMAGLVQVPVVIREMTEKEAAELALIENLQRQDLNPMEEAVGYQTLMNTYGLTQEETARVVNKSRPAVANALRLLSLPASVTELVAAGKLSAGHGAGVPLCPTGRSRQASRADGAVGAPAGKDGESGDQAAQSPHRRRRNTRQFLQRSGIGTCPKPRSPRDRDRTGQGRQAHGGIL